MKNKIVFILGAFLFCSSVYSAVGYNPYQRNSASYHNPIKKIIREENKQEGRMLEIRFLRRPLDADFLGFQDMSKGTIAHVQIVAYDKATGKYYDDFGYTGNFLKDEKGKVFKEFEDGIIEKYELKSLGSIEMSSECYKKVKNATIDKLEDIYYAPLNNVDVKTYVALGAGGGTQIAGLAGAVVGSVGGLLSAADTYSQSGRKNYKVVSDDKRQMSFPGVNCQTAADIFIAIGEMMYTLGEIATWDVKDKYIQPGPHQKNNGKNLEGDSSSKTKPEMIACDESQSALDSPTPKTTETTTQKEEVAKAETDDVEIMGDRRSVIKAIELLISCLKERNAAVESVSRSRPKRAMNDIRGILSDSNAISAESAKYAKRVEECIEGLKGSFLEMEKELRNGSVNNREKKYNSIKPHIIELFEILRDSPDKIRHRVEKVIPIQLAMFLVNGDSNIREKYYLLPTFGIEF